MERGVVIGGILISASFLFAVLLNRSADDPPAPGSGSISRPVDRPGCCAPANKECPASKINGNSEQAHGFDGCPRDDEARRADGRASTQ